MLTGNESPSTIAKVLSMRLGLSWVDLDIEVLEEEILKDRPTPAILREKIRAIRVCNTSPLVWTSFEVFSPIVQAFCGKIPVFNRHIELSPGEIATGVHFINELRNKEFSEDIPKFVAVCHLHEGIHFCPFSHLSFCKEWIQPYDEKAEKLFESIKTIPPDEVAVDETPEGVQAVLAYANTLFYKEQIGG